MNLFVILLLAISLGGSAWIGFEPIDNWLERTMAVVATTAMVPAIALFQSGMVVQRFHAEKFGKKEFESIYRRMTVAHALVWLAASASIIWVLRWQDVVRGSWQLGNWPVLDELTILLPGIFGIVASWLVFYELQLVLVGPTSCITRSDGDGCGSRSLQSIMHHIGQWLRPRWEFIAIRFRVYFLAILVPMAFVVLSIDLHQLKVLESNSQLQYFAIVGGLILALAWPLVLMLIWNTEAIPKPVLLKTLSALQRPEFGQLRFRRWNTGGQIANAVVIGWLPRMRYIFLSDVILDKFPCNETAAIVRHETGHIRRNHAWWRLAQLMLPVLVLSMHQSWLNATASVPLEIKLGGSSWDILVAPAWAGFLMLLTGAAWCSNRWLSHQMEHEADLDAIQSHPSLETEKADLEDFSEPPLDRIASKGMQAALWRLAAYAGDDWKRATLFHPSLSSRLEFLDSVERETSAAESFRTGFSRTRRRLLWGWLVVAAAGLFIG